MMIVLYIKFNLMSILKSNFFCFLVDYYKI
nr:MAG TPA: hypothetical protein [Caudoviricetes sp.]